MEHRWGTLGYLGACTPGHRLHDRIAHTLLPGEVIEAVPGAAHGHLAIDPGQHLHLSPDAVAGARRGSLPPGRAPPLVRADLVRRRLSPHREIL